MSNAVRLFCFLNNMYNIKKLKKDKFVVKYLYMYFFLLFLKYLFDLKYNDNIVQENLWLSFTHHKIFHRRTYFLLSDIKSQIFEF